MPLYFILGAEYPLMVMAIQTNKATSAAFDVMYLPIPTCFLFVLKKEEWSTTLYQHLSANVFKSLVSISFLLALAMFSLEQVYIV